MLFLLAYACSGFAGLIYQVCWTRLLTLYIGHTTAAASAVVAAFLGGLAVGAAIGGVRAARVTPRQALVTYAALEIFVALAALALPFEARAFTPLLAWAYDDGSASALFPAVRLFVCLLMVFVPATALGATFPMAIRWFAATSHNRAQSSGALYAMNTVGAAAGALLGGFVLIPAIGISGTTLVGVAAGVVAALCVVLILAGSSGESRSVTAGHAHSPRSRRRSSHRMEQEPNVPRLDARLASVVLGLSGFAALVHEIAWTRVLTMILGPTIYAFAAALAAVIVGIAIGSAAGTAALARTRRPAAWLALVLAAAAVVGIGTSSLAGGPIPRFIAEQMATAPSLFNELLVRGALLTATLVVPTAALLGAAFPLALGSIDDTSDAAASRFASIYAVNTAGSVLGSLAAGFAIIPAFGLETTLRVVALFLLLAAALVFAVVAMPRATRVAGLAVGVAALFVMALSPRWDRELLASGAYLYAPFAPKGANLEALLKAGTLLYYREGAAATVSVKRLTGTTTLAVDGKTDASNRGDMLTQKLVAHLPLLLHDNPREVAVVGLGSGVTVGAALTHPVAGVDVIEISPEVVDASRLFIEENRHALADPRTHLLVGDGRSHLQLSRRKYDVIVSEPSNPWIAGVAALFTREFFLAARERLAPGGMICQWANAYNISDGDLRSIVATFRSVFPHGTAWLVGADDVVLLASDGPLDERLANIERHWKRPGVSEDLATVAAVEPFALWSLFVAGPAELERYGESAGVLSDDRMALEFSAPKELHGRSAGENGATLKALLRRGEGPEVIRRAVADADSNTWTRRGRMMAQRDAHSSAYGDFVRALALDATNSEALDGLVRAAVLTKRGGEALSHLESIISGHPPTTRWLVARSKLLAASGLRDRAREAATQASARDEAKDEALAQLASLQSDDGDSEALGMTIARMREAAPDAAATSYYMGVAAFLQSDAQKALGLAQRALQISPSYAAAYDLIGAAHTKLGQVEKAREAFLSSLRFDAHDSTAYTNLGILELNAGNTVVAADWFAEALWLDADSSLAREGLKRATGVP